MSVRGMFTGRQVTTMVVATAAALIFAPTGAIAASNTVSLVDAKHRSQKASVSKSGALSVALQPGAPVVVGDGSGPLSVDGTVGVSGQVRGLAPASSWSQVVNEVSNASFERYVLPPVSGTIFVTSVTVANELNLPSDMVLRATDVPASATTCVGAPKANSVPLFLAGVVTYQTFSTSFPTPLVHAPAAGMKTCLSVFNGYANTHPTVTVTG